MMHLSLEPFVLCHVKERAESKQQNFFGVYGSVIFK